MADISSKTYLMIQTEVTEDLVEALQWAEQPLLDTLWQNTAKEGDVPQAGSRQVAELLAPRLLGYFREQLVYMAPERLELMAKIMQGERMSDEDVLRVMEELVPFGMVTAFLVNGSCHFCVLRQFTEILQATLQDPDQQMQMRIYRVFRNVVKACLTLYGGFTRRELTAVYISCAAAPGESREMSHQIVEAIWSFLPVLQAEGLLSVDGDLVRSSRITESAFAVVRENRDAFGMYVPDRNPADNYMHGLYAEKNPEYQQAARLLLFKRGVKMKKDVLMEEAARKACQEDAEPIAIIGYMSQYVNFPANQKAADRLTAALDAWLLTIRRWSLYGHSRKEADVANQMQVDPAAVLGARTVNVGSAAKTYPNDPCPCGSGRKYKHCCGKKEK